MKTLATYLLSLSILPVALSAQPVMTQNEYYNVGQVIQMVNCDPSTAPAGDTGSNITWDFSGLTQLGGITTATILHDTSSVFTTSDLMEVMPNGSVVFLQQSSSQSTQNGVYDTNSHITTYYTNYNTAERPFTFGSYYFDSFRVNVPATGSYGGGWIVESGDGYGTLILPGATYTNVLRVKKTQVERDTLGATVSLTATTSYLWFDTANRPPLLRIDSVEGVTTESQTVTYLLPSESVGNVKAPQSNFNGYFDNSEHLLVNGFEAGKEYQVAVYNIIGNKVFSETVAATGSFERFDMSRQISPGIYVVSITMKNEPYGTSVFKVVKTE